MGENGVTAVLNSEETDNICPSDASSWSYVDGSQVNIIQIMFSED